MTHRNRLLTFGTCSALIVGSAFIAASPAAAAPASASCVSAQTALGAALDSASVDIGLAYDLKAALAAVEAAGLALEAAWIEADLAATEEYAAVEAAYAAYDEAAMALEATAAAVDAAQTVKILADDRVKAAELALAAVAADDTAGRVAAEAELTAALAAQAEATTALTARQAERDAAPAALAAAEEVLMEAENALNLATNSEAVIAAENAYYAAVEVIEAVLADLDGAGTSPEEVQVLVNAALAACAATGTEEGTGQDFEVPVVAVTPSTPPAPGGAAPETTAVAGRGLNIQSAAADSAPDNASVLTFGGAAGVVLVLLSGAVGWLRRSARA
ncbi:hypothetical protein [Arthrobacter sp. TMN-50]